MAGEDEDGGEGGPGGECGGSGAREAGRGVGEPVFEFAAGLAEFVEAGSLPGGVGQAVAQQVDLRLQGSFAEDAVYPFAHVGMVVAGGEAVGDVAGNAEPGAEVAFGGLLVG